MRKLFFTAVLSLFFSHCYLHHANIAGDGYGIKTIINSQNEIKEQLPIRIEFDPREKEKIRQYLERKGQNVEISDNLIATYYSEEIISKFKNSKYFVHTPDANIKIKIISSIEEVRVPLFSRIAQIGTLGLYPAITRTYGRVEFNLFDNDRNKIIKTYKYGIEHRQLEAFSSALLGMILPSFSERFDHSQNERTYAVMRVAFNQFNIDLVNELGTNKEILSRFMLSKPTYYALFLEPKEGMQVSKAEELLLSGLETMFIDNKLNLVERKKIKKIIEEIKLSQYGLTDSKRQEFGRLVSADNLIEVSNITINSIEKSKGNKSTFSIRCISVETGKILWSETMLINGNENTSNEDLVKSAIESLVRELQLKGIL